MDSSKQLIALGHQPITMCRKIVINKFESFRYIGAYNFADLARCFGDCRCSITVFRNFKFTDNPIF